jgi:predicted enzyme related to lactoylglutathione lyase
MSPPKSFHYVELSAESIDRAAAFYEQVFGWRFEAPPDEHEVRDIVYFEGAPEVGLRQRGAGTDAATVKPAICVDSIDETLAAVERAGGRALEGAVDVGDGFTGFFADTEGNVIGLWAFK